MPKISDEVYAKCLVDAAKAGDLADVVRAVRVLSRDDSFNMTKETREREEQPGVPKPSRSAYVSNAVVARRCARSSVSRAASSSSAAF